MTGNSGVQPVEVASPIDPLSHRGRAGAGQVVFALVMIGLGVRGLVYGDFASGWQRIPIAHLPAREFFIYGCAVIELLTGAGLLFARTIKPASRILFAYLCLWALLLKLPAVLYFPLMEATWLGLGEITLMVAGAWALVASAWSDTGAGSLLAGERGIRAARMLYAFSLPTIGLSHLVYTRETIAFIPTWLPWHLGWAYLTGFASLATSVAVLIGIWPRLAATLEAAMLVTITVLVWLPGLVADPGDQTSTPFLMSTAIACGAWLVAASYNDVPWFGVPKRVSGALARSA